jgi:signal transduction histidine kinase/DNA-binding response OmpR family regulator/ligand-binding sensor domain-containing protein
MTDSALRVLYLSRPFACIKLILWCFFLPLPHRAHCQSGSNPELRVQRWNSANGLPEWYILSFLQDRNGLMWMVSDGGLFTFDGYTFRKVEIVKANTSISRIIRITEDLNGNIWLIRTEPEGCRIDVLITADQHIEPLHRYLSVPEPIIFREGELLCYNKNGRIWTGTVREIWLYDGSWRKILQNRNKLPSERWLPAPDRSVWTRADDHVYLTDSTGTRTDSFFDPGYVLRYLWTDNELTAWLAYSVAGETDIDHFVRLSVKAGRILAWQTKSWPELAWRGNEILGTDEARFISHGMMYSERNGIDFLGFPGQSRPFNLDEPGIDFKSFNNYYFDRSGNIWNNDTKGLIRLSFHPESRFQTFLSDVSSPLSIRGIAEINGNLCALSYGGAKQIRLNSGVVSPLNFPGDKIGSAIIGTADGLLIGGFQTPVVSRRHDGHITLLYAEKKVVNTRCFLQMENGDVYAGTDQGLYRVDRGRKELIPTGFSGRDIYFLYRNQDGIWACTSGGLYRLDNNGRMTGQYLTPDARLNYERLEHIHEDGNGIFWIATKGTGIIRWNPATQETSILNTANSLSNNNIHAIYPDEFNTLWISSDCGLMRFNRETGRVNTFFEEDGISNNEFNTLSHFRSSDGRLYFGGINGITAFYPRDIPLEREIPNRLRVVEARTFDLRKGTYDSQIIRCSAPGQLVLKTTDAYLDIEVSPMLYENNERNQYAWKIDGVHEHWIIQQSPVIRLSNLPYGHQVLRIKFGRQGNSWPEEALEIPVRVEYPFYFRWPFVLLMLALLSGIIALATFWRGRQLRAANIMLEQEVARRTQQIEADRQIIARQAQELRHLDEMKTRFFVNVTHELRTPLTLILGPLERLIRINDEPKLTEQLNVIQRSARKLLNLVEELLDLSKIDAKKLLLEEKPVHFYPFLSRVLSVFVPHAEYRQIKLDFIYDCPYDHILLVDPGKWEKIINNLIGNALKFTPGGGRITLAVSQNADRMEVSVSDTGHGIAPDDLPRIFERYYQAGGENTSLQGGTGIGLALSREYARLFGGDLVVESTPGAGSIFTVISPFKLVPGVIGEEEYTDTAPAAVQSLISHTPKDTNRFTVLIVEDDRDITAHISSILSDNYHLLTAENGRKALQLIEKHPVDLILSDIMMPEMDGFQLLQAVKEIHPDLPFIMLTARVETPDRLYALRLGVDDYLTKPFLEAELVARLENLLKRYEIRREIRLSEVNSLMEVATPGVNSGSYDRKWLAELEEIVNTNIGNSSFDSQFLAEKMNVSRRNLHYRIRAYTGLTPNQYIVEARLARAKYLLETRAFETVAEVCYAVGMKTTQYFSRLMRQRFGKAPSEY